MKHSELVFIMDRSGSMSGIASDMEGAMKEVIQKQKKREEDVLVTYVRFDSEYEEVFHEKSISEIDGFELEPRGMTALLDAIGKTVNTVERRFNQKDEEDQPERILFVIVTDGGENASREFSRPQIFEMIEKIKRDYDWGITFIGANQDAIGTGSGLGISRGSSVNYKATSKGVRAMTQSVSCYVDDYLSTGEATYGSEDIEE
jgi:Mg-chelatase subunit ChlD